MPKKVEFTETVLRDGQQSQIATRMPIEDMLPILETMDNCGYRAIEMWGGATFDACLRFLNEDPWERLRTIRSHIKKTKLQMLLRGQNLLGYRNYADDVVSEVVKKSVENGIDVVRVFDALNDVRNLKTSIRACKQAGGECQCAICYTTSPVHTVPYFVDLAKKMADAGADSLCIKDMAGNLTPDAAYELVSGIKAVVSLPLEVHTHATAGIAEMTYLKAVEAGANVIDTCISSFSGGTSQPATESMHIALTGLGYETNLDLDALGKVSAHFNDVRNKFRKEGKLNPKVKDTDPKALVYQVPGGMLSNLLSQLSEQKNEDRFEEVLAEVPRVRADLGYPPLVTPLSQMVGTQALINVISGERYKIIPKEIKDYVRGRYGASPAPISDKMRKKIIGNEKPISCRPADLIEPQLPSLTREISLYAHSEEDILSYAMFPQQAKDYLGRREDPFYDVPEQDIVVHLELNEKD
jgi:oxaloacetate decarboxylase alpha subunit